MKNSEFALAFFANVLSNQILKAAYMCIHDIHKKRPSDVNIQKQVVTSLCKNPDFLLFVHEVCEKIVHVHMFWYHYVHSMTVL